MPHICIPVCSVPCPKKKFASVTKKDNAKIIVFALARYSAQIESLKQAPTLINTSFLFLFDIQMIPILQYLLGCSANHWGPSRTVMPSFASMVFARLPLDVHLQWKVKQHIEIKRQKLKAIAKEANVVKVDKPMITSLSHSQSTSVFNDTKLDSSRLLLVLITLLRGWPSQVWFSW